MAVFHGQGSISPALAGLSLVYALDLTKFLKQSTNTASKSESDFNSVERIVQYLKEAPEGDPAIESGQKPEPKIPQNWPLQGGILMKEVGYRCLSVLVGSCTGKLVFLMAINVGEFVVVSLYWCQHSSPLSVACSMVVGIWWGGNCQAC